MTRWTEKPNPRRLAPAGAVGLFFFLGAMTVQGDGDRQRGSALRGGRVEEGYAQECQETSPPIATME